MEVRKAIETVQKFNAQCKIEELKLKKKRVKEYKLLI